MNKPSLSKADIKRLQEDFGVDNLYMDDQGNIRDKMTRQIVHQRRSAEEVQTEERQHCKEYFRSLPVAVQNALLKAALEHSVQDAIEQMDAYSVQRKNSERWCLPYEELAKIVAEKVLLDEG